MYRQNGLFRIAIKKLHSLSVYCKAIPVRIDPVLAVSHRLTVGAKQHLFNHNCVFAAGNLFQLLLQSHSRQLATGTNCVFINFAYNQFFQRTFIPELDVPGLQHAGVNQ